MNVNPNSPQQPSGQPAVAPGASRVRTPGPESRGTGSHVSRSSEPLDLSARAQEFLRIRPQLERLPEVSREERIAQLRGLIARGEYRVPGERIAAAMLRDEAMPQLLGLTPAR